MTCTNQCPFETEKLSIVQGQDIEPLIYIIDEETCTPFDLTGVTEIRALFNKTDGTKLIKTYTLSGGVTIISDLGGKIKVTLTAANTALLKTGECQSFEVEITKATKINIIQFLGKLNVYPRV